MTISILKAERFYPLGKPLPRPEEAKDVVDAVQIRPGIWRKPDGTMETRGYETPKVPAKPAVAAVGDWIEWAGGEECPIPDADEGDYEIRWSDGSINKRGPATDWRWFHEDGEINLTAYRLIPTEAA
jgi:hypothetical protein